MTKDHQYKGPPHDLEAEERILAYATKNIIFARHLLGVDDFYSEKHRERFKNMKKAANRIRIECYPKSDIQTDIETVRALSEKRQEIQRHSAAIEELME